MEEEIHNPGKSQSDLERPDFYELADGGTSPAQEDLFFELPAGLPAWAESGAPKLLPFPAESVVSGVVLGRVDVDELGDSPLELPPLDLPDSFESDQEPGCLEEVVDQLDTQWAPPERPLSAQETRYVVFQLFSTSYALPLANLLETARVPPVTFVPNVPHWIRGVTNVRGEVLSVIDLRAFFGLGPIERASATRMLVVRNLAEDVTTGVIVDSVRGLRELPALTQATAPMRGRVASFVQGVCDTGPELLVVFDMERFLACPEVRLFDAS